MGRLREELEDGNKGTIRPKRVKEIGV